ncbi:MAG: hypothetical protein KF777_02875 [Planctomycetaceae bacterium]|nr:hypothetical protein [Planctomycetaceae bacterium]
MNPTHPAFRACLLSLAVAALVVSSISVARVHGKDDPQTLSTFMRKKLDASSLILEGITIEDPKLVSEGADVLLEMSRTEIWNVLTDEDYREFNREFRSSVRKLKEAVGDKNFDNATLQWMDSVKACVECHKYVRSQRPVLKKQ